jgi:DNA processing protein
MNYERIALIALLRTRPDGLSWPRLTEEVLECGSAYSVWERYNPDQLIPSPIAAAALEDAEADLLKWERDGLQIMSVLDKEFPQRLLDIVETPPFLFAQGRIDLDDPGMSVVGSRKASDRGVEMASNIARFLVRQGLTVISGLAAGIDTAAHTAALGEGGRTVAFLGTGCNVSYPAKNGDLQAAIADHGLVLSQFWPDAPPQKHSFPMRNALMSGYGLATIVVEAGETSGARIQARLAVEHGRPVILSDMVVERNEWARTLMRRPGVHMVSSLKELNPIVDEIRSEPQRTEEALRQLAFR